MLRADVSGGWARRYGSSMGAQADVAVVGLGAIGSSAAWRLAARGLDVVGIDQHEPGHAWGGSHGRTRLFRAVELRATILSDRRRDPSAGARPGPRAGVSR